MRALAVAALTCLAMLAAVPMTSAAPRTTLSDIEDEVMCPTCGTALSLSESPLAERQRAFIQRLVDQGRSKDEIKARLVDEFGPGVLAEPPREGFALTAYLVPLAVAVIMLGALGFALSRRRGRSDAPEPAPSEESFEDLVDADLAAARR